VPAVTLFGGDVITRVLTDGTAGNCALWLIDSGNEQAVKTSFDKMVIAGEGVGKPQFSHHDKASAIGERVLVIRVLGAINDSVHFLVAHRAPRSIKAKLIEV
jgi:hypothetical protein